MSVRLLVLWCPDWPVVAARAEDSTLFAESPIVLAHAGAITHCSAPARRRGARIGQRLRDAQATAPDLVALAADSDRDQRVWQQVLQALSDTVARIAVIEPGLLALRAPGLARYYGSEQQAAWEVAEAVRAVGWIPAVRIGIADTLFAATQAAYYATTAEQMATVVDPGGDRDFLATLPLGVLDDSDLVSTLGALGLQTLADFAALDAHQLAQRFGDHAALLHACARGVDPRHSSSIDIPPSTDRHWRSDQPISRADELSFALRATVDDFLAGLTAQHVVCTTVRLSLVDDRGETHSQVWSHPRFFTAADLVNRVRWQWESLARHSSEEYHDGGVSEVVFQALSPENLFGHEPGLWGGAEVNSRVEHSIARLQSSLGHQAVTRAELRPGHGFDEREVLVPWGTQVRTEGATTQATAEFVGQLPRPLPASVFQPPTPVGLTDASGHSVSVHDAALTGPPAVLQSGSHSRDVVAWAGPWPVVERWWDQQAARRRYRLQLLDDQEVGWLISQDGAGGSWQVEARYD